MSQNSYFPIFLKLEGRKALVVGGGEVAARKIRLLRKAGAQVQVVARELNAELDALCQNNALEALGASFTPDQIAGCALVVAATDDGDLNRAVAAAAEARQIPCNVVDDAGAGSFIMPAVIDRSPLTVAVSSGGTAPVLARRLRERFESELPAELGRLAQFMGARRGDLEAIAPADRRAVWEAFIDGPGAEQAMRGEDAAAQQQFAQLLDGKQQQGEVYLVGAGPGDPDLLSFRALRLMQQADVVLYDRLLPPDILDLVRRDAERIFVGKKRNEHTVPQAQINAELIRQAKMGRRVLRLKGGDPFMFGRGGEEIAELAASGIPFQIVPGITAANGCAAYAGIPLTHRDYAQSCIFITGHARADGSLDLHWDQLARRGQTVVIYMGRAQVGELCAQLIKHGLPDDWPAAMVVSGTRADQEVVIGTLSSLPAIAPGEQAHKGPGLVMVGEVVKLHASLGWIAKTEN